MWSEALRAGHFGIIEEAASPLILGPAVRPLVRLSAVNIAGNAAPLSAVVDPCILFTASDAREAVCADDHSARPLIISDRFGEAKQFVTVRASLATTDASQRNVADGLHTSTGVKSQSDVKLPYVRERDSFIATIAATLRLEPLTVEFAVSSIRGTILSAAARVLTTRFRSEQLTAAQRTILCDTAESALERPLGLVELIRLFASVDTKAVPAEILLVVMETELELRRQYGHQLRDVELLLLLSEHLGPRGAGRYQGSAELLYILGMVSRGATIARVQ